MMTSVPGMPMKPNSAESSAIWINARFLARPVSGVERVAREFLAALVERLDANGSWITPEGRRLSFRLIAPAASRSESPWPKLPVHCKGAGGGHLWEQTSLLAATRGDWLVSLCNTGPMLKRRHVIFFHDAQTFAIPENFTWRFRWWYRVLFSVAGRMSAAILTNSDYSRNELVKRVGLDQSRITPTWLGVEHVRRVPPDTGVFAKHRLPDTPYLLAVSSVNPNKNFAAVLRALELLGAEAPPCVIAGQCYDRVFGQSGLDTKRVTHVGYVSDAELYALYSRAMCLLFPSFSKGFGLPPVEAMALGCPAIVSDASVLPEICGDAALYCDPARPETLAAAIRRLCAEPGLRDDLVARGIERTRVFSWSNGAEALLKTLSKAMDGRLSKQGLNNRG
jgi:glycosyltransferase involved in cell wall biosynthesis